ncbi:unnamed protein product [Peniophora sp. CBMAI 1063]|nr:unnamed protein product [Peniophora sp. CBMAI 1063]
MSLLSVLYLLTLINSRNDDDTMLNVVQQCACARSSPFWDVFPSRCPCDVTRRLSTRRGPGGRDSCTRFWSGLQLVSLHHRLAPGQQCPRVASSGIPTVTVFSRVVEEKGHHAPPLAFLRAPLTLQTMAMASTTTTDANASPPTPFYLSPLSHFLLRGIYSEGKKSYERLWHKRDQAFIAAHPSAFDAAQPKIIPRLDDGKKMVGRFRKRIRRPWIRTWYIVQKFHCPFSKIKRIHGPSKLRLEITADEAEWSAVDFTPIRSMLLIDGRRDPMKDLWLYQIVRGKKTLVLVRVYVKRLRKVPKDNDAEMWEDLFGRYKEDRSLLGDNERALDRRGCWRDGRVVQVVDDEIFPGWGEKYDEEYDEEEDYRENAALIDIENALPSSSAVTETTCDLSTATETAVKKRRRDDSDDQGDQGSTMAIIKRTRVL